MIAKNLLIAISFGVSIAQLHSQPNDTLIFNKPEKLSNQVNSLAEESFPIWNFSDSTLYFARTFHASNTGNNKATQDIWYAQRVNNNWSGSKNLDLLNTGLSDVVAGVSRGGKRIYLLHQRIDKHTEAPGLSITDFDEGTQTWKEPTPVYIPDFEISGSFYSIYVNEAESIMLLSLPTEGDSLGNDLYVSLSADRGGQWSKPKSLGSVLNSAQDEISPFLDEKLGMLFYAVNKPENPLDYDIFYSKQLDQSWTNWSAPVPAAALNSPKFDAYYFASSEGEIFFSSNRADSLSSIYLSEWRLAEPEAPDTVEAVAEEPTEPILIIQTKDGTQTDRKLSSMSKAELVEESTNIRFVYFDFDKYNISAKYIEVLDDASELLDKYPELDLRIEGHTDAVGSESYNQVLSENRAGSVKEYMVIHGIDPSRVYAIGFGKQRPLASNYTDEGRAMNRRVELFFTERK